MSRWLSMELAYWSNILEVAGVWMIVVLSWWLDMVWCPNMVRVGCLNISWLWMLVETSMVMLNIVDLNMEVWRSCSLIDLWPIW